MADKAQILVNELKKYFKEGDLPSAYSCWCKIYDLFAPNENMTWQEKENLFKEQQKYMSQISDEAVFAITDYGREKYYREHGYYGEPTENRPKCIGIVYNYKGLSETNFIFTRVDAIKNISSWLGEQVCNDIMEKLEDIGCCASGLSANKTYEFYDLSDAETLQDFINGEYNDNILETCLGNYDNSLSIEDNYKRYSDWYWQLEAVSKEYESTLGQYVGVVHSMPDFEEFKRIVAERNGSLDVITDNEQEKHHGEQGLYGEADYAAPSRIGIVAGASNVCENNFIFTKKDALDYIHSKFGEDECKRIMQQLGSVGFSIAKGPTGDFFVLHDLSNDSKLQDFLEGKNNYNPLENCLKNYDASISAEENYNKYSHWYWQLEAVSKEYEADLGQYVGVAHSMPKFADFEKLVSIKDSFLDSIIKKAIDESQFKNDFSNSTPKDIPNLE